MAVICDTSDLPRFSHTGFGSGLGEDGQGVVVHGAVNNEIPGGWLGRNAPGTWTSPP